MHDICVAVGKVLTAPVLFVALITVAELKDIVLILGAVVTMICTVCVTISTVNKNKRS